MAHLLVPRACACLSGFSWIFSGLIQGENPDLDPDPIQVLKNSESKSRSRIFIKVAMQYNILLQSNGHGPIHYTATRRNSICLRGFDLFLLFRIYTSY